MSENNDETGKTINILGTNNRYLVNKLKKEEKVVKLRKNTTKIGFPEDFYSIENQIEIIGDLYNNNNNINNRKILSQIEQKLHSYKQQDLLKKKYNEEMFIRIKDTIDKLYESKLLCHYCNEKMFLLYDIVRETKQWTLDRINNDIGHQYDNIVIACLDCNLKRRRTNKDAFLFTKQLNIVKSESESK
jgi:5-methylcytosine-specific restriction endonuclease McrA